MKKIFTLFLIVIAFALAFMGVKRIKASIDYKNYVSKVKKGWYLEVLIEDLNVRDEANQHSNILDTVKKGEVYKIIDYEINNTGNYWYKIELMNKGTGWVANPKKGVKYIETFNGKIDVATPTIKFKENEYHVISIKNINYDHLTAWDDSDDYEITHIICHEYPSPTNNNQDQYWIKYTITDGSGKSSSKKQRIIFEKVPDEDKMIDFDDERCQ